MTDRMDPDDELGEAPSVRPDAPEVPPEVYDDPVEDDPSVIHEPVAEE
jgi:hypothetical protein